MRRRAFTLVELLVVTDIVALLVGILVPVVAKAHRYALRNRMKSDILAIGLGLDAYRGDHRDYPRLTTGGPDVDGAVLLCWALLSPGPVSQDGADGAGFRLRGAQGQVYGPYLNINRFRVSGTDDHSAEIVDVNDRPIHYCPSNPTATYTNSNGFVSDTSYGSTASARPLYDHAYFEYCLDLSTMRKMMGDTNGNGQIDAGETPASTAPYLIWAAGPDGLFGPDPGDPTGARSDDVTNFAK